MFLRDGVYFHKDPGTGTLLYFDDARQEWLRAPNEPPTQPPPLPSSPIQNIQNNRTTNDDTSATNPYSQLKHHDLHFNNFDSYVIPLEEQEFIQGEARNSRNPSAGRQPDGNGTTVDPRDLDGAQVMNNAWQQMRPSPVQHRGLESIETSRVEEPTENPEYIKRQREAEYRQLRIPRSDPNSLQPVDCSNRGNGSAIASFVNNRDRELDSVQPDAPPPESVHCGWSEYQGGATWEDINRYRDQEMNTLLQIQEQQRAGTEPVYYF